MSPLEVERARADTGAAVLLAAFCLWALYVTTTFDPPVLRGYPGAAFFPQLILIVLLGFSVLLLVRGIRAWRSRAAGGEADATADGEPIRFDLLPFLWSVAAVLLLIVLIQQAGFEVACALFLATLLGVRSGRWLRAIAIALLSTGVMYVIFVLLLKVHLPLLFLPRYL